MGRVQGEGVGFTMDIEVTGFVLHFYGLHRNTWVLFLQQRGFHQKSLPVQWVGKRRYSWWTVKSLFHAGIIVFLLFPFRDWGSSVLWFFFIICLRSCPTAK